MNFAHPLKSFNFCPKCGSSLFIIHDSRSKKCQNCNFHYFFNASGATIAIIETDKEELIVVRRGIEPHLGKLDLPGGFIDLNETAEECIVREIKEELNCDIIHMEYITSLPNKYSFSDFEVATIDFVFKCRISSIEDIKPMDDVSEILLIKRDFLNLKLFPFYSTRTCADYLKRKIW